MALQTVMRPLAVCQRLFAYAAALVLHGWDQNMLVRRPRLHIYGMVISFEWMCRPRCQLLIKT